MYDRFISRQKTEPIIYKAFFVFVPCIIQNLFFLIYFISLGDSTLVEIAGIYFSWIGLILILVYPLHQPHHFLFKGCRIILWEQLFYSIYFMVIDIFKYIGEPLYGVYTVQFAGSE